MHLDNFEARQIKKNKDKKDSSISGSGKKVISKDDKPSSKNEMKSSKFFSKLQEVAKDDATRKEQKKKNKIEGYNRNFQPAQHNNESTKRFKL